MTTARGAFAAACGGMMLFGMAMLSLGTISTFVAAKHGLDGVAMGSLAALLPIGILLGSLLFGPVVDRHGYRMPLVAASLCVLGGFEMIGFGNSFPAVQGGFLLIGTGGGVLNGATNALVADISGGEKGARLSLLGVFFGIGALSMPSAMGVLQAWLPFETVVAGIGAVVVLPVMLFLGVQFPAPKQAQAFPLRSGFGLLRRPALLLCSAVLFFQSGVEGVTTTWTTSYLEQRARVPAEQALLALTLLTLSLTVARLVLSGILRRVPATRVVQCSLALALAGVGLLAGGGPAAAAYGAPLLLGAGYAAMFPVVLGMIGEMHAELSGTAFGIALVVALTGSTIINSLVGALWQAFGPGALPAVLAVSTAVLALLFHVAGRRVSAPHA